MKTTLITALLTTTLSFAVCQAPDISVQLSPELETFVDDENNTDEVYFYTTSKKHPEVDNNGYVVLKRNGDKSLKSDSDIGDVVKRGEFFLVKYNKDQGKKIKFLVAYYHHNSEKVTIGGIGDRVDNATKEKLKDYRIHSKKQIKRVRGQNPKAKGEKKTKKPNYRSVQTTEPKILKKDRYLQDSEERKIVYTKKTIEKHTLNKAVIKTVEDYEVLKLPHEDNKRRATKWKSRGKLKKLKGNDLIITNNKHRHRRHGWKEINKKTTKTFTDDQLARYKKRNAVKPPKVLKPKKAKAKKAPKPIWAKAEFIEDKDGNLKVNKKGQCKLKTTCNEHLFGHRTQKYTTKVENGKIVPNVPVHKKLKNTGKTIKKKKGRKIKPKRAKVLKPNKVKTPKTKKPRATKTLMDKNGNIKVDKLGLATKKHTGGDILAQIFFSDMFPRRTKHKVNNKDGKITVVEKSLSKEEIRELKKEYRQQKKVDKKHDRKMKKAKEDKEE